MSTAVDACCCTDTVLVCRCASAGTIPKEACDQVLAALEELDVDTVAVPDLCAMAARRDPTLHRLCSSGRVQIVACAQRAVHWMLHAAGVNFDAASIEVLDLGEEKPAQIVRTLSERACPRPHTGFCELGTIDGWAPWFPIIDYDLCSACGQCASFCLFGVFTTAADGTVTVANPSSCKNNCPACARICPQAAIMFPKLDEAPINGRALNGDEASPPRIQVDVDEMLGSDVYAALAARSLSSRRRLVNAQTIALAERERCACSCTEPAPPCAGTMLPTVDG
jgi:NAD-dependent dihydropyrimidine dehydrogenase PreA subunit